MNVNGFDIFGPLAEMYREIAGCVEPTKVRLYYNKLDLIKLGQVKNDLLKSIKKFEPHLTVKSYPSSLNDVKLDFEYKNGKVKIEIFGGYIGVKNATNDMLDRLGIPDNIKGPSILEQLYLPRVFYNGLKEEDLSKILRGELK
jgi:hypothetical protein